VLTETTKEQRRLARDVLNLLAQHRLFNSAVA